MLRLAKILKSNGTDGGLLISLLDAWPSEINLKEPVFITFDGLPVPFFIQDFCRKGSTGAIIHLNDVHNLKDSEEMVGRFILAEGRQQSGGDLVVGWKVYDGNTYLGLVSDIDMIPGNTCLNITREDGSELLVPFHEDLIQKTATRAKKIILNLPEGLY